MSQPVGSADPQPDNLDLYRFRDDLAQSYNPANGHERMLVTAIAQSWLRLQRAQDVEQRYCATRDMLDVLTIKLKEFQALTRWVTDAERAWRHAVTLLQQAQRRRQREAHQVPSSRPILKKHPVPSETAPVPAPDRAAVAPALRE